MTPVELKRPNPSEKFFLSLMGGNKLNNYGNHSPSSLILFYYFLILIQHLDLSGSNFNKTLDYLVNLETCNLTGVLLDSWDDMWFPANLKELILYETNFNQTLDYVTHFCFCFLYKNVFFLRSQMEFFFNPPRHMTIFFVGYTFPPTPPPDIVPQNFSFILLTKLRLILKAFLKGNLLKNISPSPGHSTPKF